LEFRGRQRLPEVGVSLAAGSFSRGSPNSASGTSLAEAGILGFRPAHRSGRCAETIHPNLLSPTPSLSSAQHRGKLRYAVFASTGRPSAFTVETGHSREPSPAAGSPTFLESPTTGSRGVFIVTEVRQRFSEFSNYADSLSAWKPVDSPAYSHPLEGGETSVVKRRGARYRVGQFNEKRRGDQDSRNFWEAVARLWKPLRCGRIGFHDDV
jgi:hypothetical protein